MCWRVAQTGELAFCNSAFVDITGGRDGHREEERGGRDRGGSRDKEGQLAEAGRTSWKKFE